MKNIIITLTSECWLLSSIGGSDELKLKIIERYDEPADSTAHKIMKMIFGSEATPADSTDTN
ncbi:MAG: hypothetical protein MK225_01745 [Candidatus Marinimicrobia bacterium]|nr:hypothetical protein [Candidatus Neomarinimicrobiota bacterium]